MCMEFLEVLSLLFDLFWEEFLLALLFPLKKGFNSSILQLLRSLCDLRMSCNFLKRLTLINLLLFFKLLLYLTCLKHLCLVKIQRMMKIVPLSRTLAKDLIGVGWNTGRLLVLAQLPISLSDPHRVYLQSMLHFTISHPFEHCGCGATPHGEEGIGCNSLLLRPTASQLSIGRWTHLKPLRAKDQTFFELSIVEVDFISAHDWLLLWAIVVSERTNTFKPSIVKDEVACVKWFGL
jgi:hypothetical protein